MSPEELAEVRVFLDRLTHERLITKPFHSHRARRGFYSPRLADSHQSWGLQEQVIDGYRMPRTR